MTLLIVGCLVAFLAYRGFALFKSRKEAAERLLGHSTDEAIRPDPLSSSSPSHKVAVAEAAELSAASSIKLPTLTISPQEEDRAKSLEKKLRYAERKPDDVTEDDMEFLDSYFKRSMELRHQKVHMRTDRKVLNECLETIHRYVEMLSLKQKQLTYEDDYDELITDDWDREVRKFAKSKFLYSCRWLIEESKEWRDLISLIDHEVTYYQFRNSSKEDDSCSLDTVTDPYEYERLVAEGLEKLGWRTKNTGSSGDQGVDIVATKNGTKLVVQCKLYSQPVGNKAVQEVFAAKAHENANVAAVVTNASFTPSARRLSATTGVLLLHHENLSDINELLEFED